MGDLWGTCLFVYFGHMKRVPISINEVTTTQPDTVFSHIVANEFLFDSSGNGFVYSSAGLSTIALGHGPLHLSRLTNGYCLFGMQNDIPG